MIPTSIMVIGAALVYGNLFGVTRGFLVSLTLVIISADLGALISFTIGRLFLRNYIRKYIITKIKLFNAIDIAIEHNGLKMATILRLTPLIPPNLYPYIMSVTSLSYSNLVIGHSFGMLPLTSIYVYFAAHLSSLADIKNGVDLGPYSFVIITLGIVVVTWFMLIIVSYAKQELDRLLEKEKNEKI